MYKSVLGLLFASLTLLSGCGSSSLPSGSLSGSGGFSGTPLATMADAVRLLDQSSFGPTDASIAQVQAQGIAGFVDSQLATPATGYPGYSYITADSSKGCPTGSAATCYRDNYTVFPVQNQFFRNAVTGPDQLRQRVAFALSQIMVTSGLTIGEAYAMAAYQQVLLNDAFGTYRQLLNDVTLSPEMGTFLNMVNNDKANASAGTNPNENYAREVNQLFAIGTVMLNADGTPTLDSNGATIPTYTQTTVDGFAALFTGWTYPPLPGATSAWTNPQYWLGQMVPFAAHHDMTAKTLLNGTVLPAGQDAPTDLSQGLDNIANHPNVGPFIGKQLIQFLVTGNPSAAYVARITAVFNDDGKGVRGNLGAVVRAILLDPEARGDVITDPNYGRMREPAQLLAGVIRGIGGGSYTDGQAPATGSGQEQQSVFDAGSVFSFYPPSYVIPKTTIPNPSFGIYNASTAFSRTNNLATLLSGDIPADSTVNGSTGTHLDMTAWDAAASDPVALTAKINALFFHGAMPASMASTLESTISAMDASNLDARARAALYLALSSIQFQVVQ